MVDLGYKAEQNIRIKKKKEFILFFLSIKKINIERNDVIYGNIFVTDISFSHSFPICTYIDDYMVVIFVFKMRVVNVKKNKNGWLDWRVRLA